MSVATLPPMTLPPATIRPRPAPFFAMTLLPTLALMLAALLALIVTSAGCSSGIDEPLSSLDDGGAFRAPAPPVPLSIVGPGDALVYTAADDEDPDVAGVQLTIRVDVDDDAIDRVTLTCDGGGFDDVVTEDVSGRRAAYFTVKMAETDSRRRGGAADLIARVGSTALFALNAASAEPAPRAAIPARSS